MLRFSRVLRAGWALADPILAMDARSAPRVGGAAAPLTRRDPGLERARLLKKGRDTKDIFRALNGLSNRQGRALVVYKGR
ncbi:hypothetical protein MRX96_042521 [Rhipicephalus microplus]